jgi:branched-chain amino acid transport system permease protein
MILYVISVGLSVTMGLMGFVNLAHGVFAMAGGFILSTVMARLGMPFPLALVIAAVSVAIASIVLERLLYSRLYAEGELAQVLFCIGLIFAAMAVARLLYGGTGVPARLPARPAPPARPGFPHLSRFSDCL